jgi:hypothetical protein
MTDDPVELIAQLFPRTMLNLAPPPPGQEPGPLRALFTIASTILKQFIADSLLAKAQLSVQQAGGPYLDKHGVFYGVTRLPAEVGNDEPYRARILAAITAGRLTIPAIQSAVQAYYNSFTPAQGSAVPVVAVYDLQSNPAQCAADGTYTDRGGTVTPIVVLDFVIDLLYNVSADDAFFCDYAYCDYNYLLDNGAVLEAQISDPLLQILVTQFKAAGTNPVYRIQTNIT